VALKQDQGSEDVKGIKASKKKIELMDYRF
jgi:hypothetical protein